MTSAIMRDDEVAGAAAHRSHVDIRTFRWTRVAMAQTGDVVAG